MSQSFYWYDYETWGINPKTTRPSQFAGLRTDLDFNTIGDPLVLFSKPTDDFLPEPDAVMVTGVSPQKALEEGINAPSAFAITLLGSTNPLIVIYCGATSIIHMIIPGKTTAVHGILSIWLG